MRRTREGRCFLKLHRRISADGEALLHGPFIISALLGLRETGRIVDRLNQGQTAACILISCLLQLDLALAREMDNFLSTLQ